MPGAREREKEKESREVRCINRESLILFFFTLVRLWEQGEKQKRGGGRKKKRENFSSVPLLKKPTLPFIFLSTILMYTCLRIRNREKGEKGRG